MSEPNLFPDTPEPPVPASSDLRNFNFMPLDVVAMSSSETWGMADGWEAKACLNLWMRAWHQVPAGSLPDSDNLLRAWAGVPEWERCRSVALRGFVKCSDGRLYHLKLCERVLEAIERKAKYSKAGKSRWKKGKKDRASLERRKSDADAYAMQKKGEDRKDSPSDFSNEKSSGVVTTDQEADLFRRGKQVMGQNTGGLIKNLLTAKGGSIPLARAAIETAATKQNPREYVGGVIRGASERQLQAAVGWDPGI